MFFRDIIGQAQIKSRLITTAKDGRVAHAQMFYGNQGVGCLPMALAYAQYVCCLRPTDDDSCGECSSCRKFAKLSHPDLHFVFPIINKKTAEGSICDDFVEQFKEEVIKYPYLSLPDWQEALQGDKTPTIYTREANEIISKLNLKAFEAKYKIVIIWHAEQMQESFANRLLKVIEEPQGETLFILITDKIDDILLTIRSRSQQIFLPPIDIDNLREKLKEDDLYDKDSEFHLKNANGSYNKLMKNIVENDSLILYFNLFTSLMRACWRCNERTYFEEWRPALEELVAMSRSSQVAFLQYCQRQIRENFVYNLRNTHLNYMNREELEFSEKFAKFINEKNIEDFMSEFALAEAHIDSNINSKYVFLDLMIKINTLLNR